MCSKKNEEEIEVARLVIREIAQKQGLNQSQLQIKAGVTLQLLNRYWNNNTESVALKQIEMIAKALGVKSGDLIIDEFPASEPNS